MPDLDQLNARIQELEIKFTEQQRLLEDLSAVLFSQQREQDGLQALLRRLKDRMAEAPGLVEPGDDKPPHY